MFDLVYHPGILSLFFYKQIRELVFGTRMWVKGTETKNLSSSLFGFTEYKGFQWPHSGLTFY